ncbi:MAG: nucleotide exchange factor GrpE, partial [Rubrivivax sp.]
MHNPFNPPSEAASPAAETPHSSGSADSAAADLATQLADLQARHAEVSDAYLRAKAEAENTRRRAEEEMSKARKFA